MAMVDTRRRSSMPNIGSIHTLRQRRGSFGSGFPMLNRRSSTSHPMADERTSILDCNGGLLIALLNVFDTNGNRELSRDEFYRNAETLGYHSDDTAWRALCHRFGTVKNQPADGPDGADPVYSSKKKEGPAVPEVLGLDLLGDHFSSKYDPVLCEMLRRLLRAAVVSNERVASLASRLEEHHTHIDQLVNLEANQRQHRAHAALRKWRHQHTSRAFDGWKQLVDSRRALLRKCAATWKHSTLASVWRRWRELVSELSAQRAAVACVVGRWRNRAVSRTFLVWRDDVRRTVDARQAALTRAVGRWAHRGLALALASWVHVTRTARRARELQRKIVLRLRHGLMSGCFWAWAEETAAEAERRRALLQRAANLIIGRATASTFEAWRKATVASLVARRGREARVEALAARFLSPLTGKCFDAWRALTLHHRAVLHRATMAIGPGRLLAICFRTWVGVMVAAREARQREWMQHLIDDSLPSLIEQVVEGRMPGHIDAADHVKMLASLRMDVDSVSADVDALRQDMRQVAGTLSGVEGGRQREREARIAKIIRGWLHKCIATAFDGWAGLLRTKKTLMRKVASVWKKGPLAQAWRRWAEMAANMAAAKWALERAAATWRNVPVAKAWRRWEERAAEGRAIQRVVAKWRLADACRALNAWVEMAEARRRALGTMGRVVSRITNRILCQTFEVWTAFVADAREAAQQARLRAARVWEAWVGRSLRMSFDGWASHIAESRRLLARAAFILGDGRIVLACFNSWLSAYHAALRGRKTEAIMEQLRLVGRDWLGEMLDDPEVRDLLDVHLSTMFTRRTEAGDVLGAYGAQRVAEMSAELHALQKHSVEQVRLGIVEAQARQKIGSELRGEVGLMGERLHRLDETCNFLKNTLHTLLTAPAHSKGPLPGELEHNTAAWLRRTQSSPRLPGTQVRQPGVLLNPSPHKGLKPLARPGEKPAWNTTLPDQGPAASGMRRAGRDREQ